MDGEINVGNSIAEQDINHKKINDLGAALVGGSQLLTVTGDTLILDSGWWCLASLQSTNGDLVS